MFTEGKNKQERDILRSQRAGEAVTHSQVQEKTEEINIAPKLSVVS